MSTFGVAMLVAIELYKKWRDPWYEPRGSILMEVIQSAFNQKSVKSMSAGERQEHFFRKFVGSDRDLYGVDSYHRVRNILNLAELLASQQRFPEAEKWYEYALRLTTHNFGAEDLRCAEILSSMARMARLRVDFKEAEALISRTVQIYKDAGRSDLLIEELSFQSEVFQQTDNFEAALASLEERFELLLDVHGPIDEKLYVELRRMLALAGENQVKQQRFRKHSDLIMSLVLMQESLGADSQYMAHDLRALASFYRQCKLYPFADALDLRARMLVLMAKISSVDYPGIEHDLAAVADYLKKRAHGADSTVAFHCEQRIKRIQERRSRSRSLSLSSKAR